MIISYSCLDVEPIQMKKRDIEFECAPLMGHLMSDEYCGMVINKEGSPFEECFNSSYVNAGSLAEACKDSLCRKFMADPNKAHSEACETLDSLAKLCHNFGFKVDWRERAKCRKITITSSSISTFIYVFFQLWSVLKIVCTIKTLQHAPTNVSDLSIQRNAIFPLRRNANVLKEKC